MRVYKKGDDYMKKLITEIMEEYPKMEVGQTIQFKARVYGMWEFNLQKEKDGASLFGKGPTGTVARKYADAESALLHLLNWFNDDVNIKNRYSSLEDALNEM